MTYAHGWYCLAFEDELTAALTPVTLDGRRLMIVRHDAEIAVYDADCPHRGAHLAIGGRLEGGHVVCPYHAYRIRLGGDGGGWSVRRYDSVSRAGAIYVRLSETEDNGWPALLDALLDGYDVTPGLTIPLSTTMESVTENGFDRLHFHAVHRLSVQPFTVAPTRAGALAVSGRFSARTRDGASAESSYEATAISPGLIVVQLGGSTPYGVITGAVTTAENACTARLSFIFPKGTLATAHGRKQKDALTDYSRQGLIDDDRVWRNVARSATPQWSADDGPVRQFYDFCRRFRNDGR